MSTTTSHEARASHGHRDASSERIPGFESVTTWSTPDGRPLKGWVPRGVAGRVPPRPTSGRIAQAIEDALLADRPMPGGVRVELEVAAGMLLGMVAALAFPSYDFGRWAGMAIILTLLGGLLGVAARKIRLARGRAQWEAYGEGLAASGVAGALIPADDPLISTVQEALEMTERADRVAAPWPDLVTAGVDARTPAWSACQARVDARLAEEELTELQDILAGTRAERDDHHLAVVRARCVELAEAVELAKTRECVALEELREARGASAQVIASARARCIRGA